MRYPVVAISSLLCASCATASGDLPNFAFVVGLALLCDLL
jgi:hypothetical protein